MYGQVRHLLHTGRDPMARCVGNSGIVIMPTMGDTGPQASIVQEDSAENPPRCSLQSQRKNIVHATSSSEAATPYCHFIGF
jgi:hypothetical protein